MDNLQTWDSNVKPSIIFFIILFYSLLFAVNLIYRICFIITLFFSQAFSQDYLWPVKAKKEITAVFGEERPGRYHTGVDIRTFGEIGYHLVGY